MNQIAPDWALALEPVRPTFERLLTQFYPSQEASNAQAAFDAPPVLPPLDSVLRAFTLPLEKVKVVIVGQDPYPTPGNSMGLAFSVRPGMPVPRSLSNIFKELNSDLGLPIPTSGDLTAWHDQGVLLLNRVLTVPANQAGGHKNSGWEKVTDCALAALAQRGGPLVAVLWGKQAAQSRGLLGQIPLIESAHPSPLSARRGFFGSRPFSTINRSLVAQGGTPIDWDLTAGNSPSGQQLAFDLD